MIKKNYLSREEQRIWEYIRDKETVDTELVKAIFPEFSSHKINQLLHNLAKKDYLHRARRNLYYNPATITDFHQLALQIHPGYIAFSSALRYYHLLEYEDFTIFIITRSFRKKMDLPGTQYTLEYLPFGKLYSGYKKKDNICISTLEKTLFDCLKKPNLLGFSVITKAFYESKNINWPLFLSFFKMIKTPALYQRTGYLLELLQKETKKKIPKEIFHFFLSNVRNPIRLNTGKGLTKYNAKWKIQDNLGTEKIIGWWH
ncbi:MAG TPA: hypothetical protein VJI32_00245 [Candidatus Nanoarchaeia archaeon]|nr:hypothetical protein [Candidatus Nanoarchaeia archaeon]